MKARLIRCVTMAALAVALVPALVDAQARRPPRFEPPSEGSSCRANGIRCFFGSAAGCSVTCTSGSPVCIGARCVLGFPISAECYCEGVSP